MSITICFYTKQCFTSLSFCAIKPGDTFLFFRSRAYCRLCSVMAFRLSNFTPHYFLILCVSVQVRALDNGSPPRFTDHSLTVNIMDVNDNAPVVQSPRGYNVSVSEVSATRPAYQTTSEPRGPQAVRSQRQYKLPVIFTA